MRALYAVRARISRFHYQCAAGRSNRARVATRATRPTTRAARRADKTSAVAPAPSHPVTAGSPAVVAVTGAFGAFGRRLIKRLEADPTVERIVAIDIKSPLALDGKTESDTQLVSFLARHTKLSAHTLDLTQSDADLELSRTLRAEGVGALMHLALLSTPTHALEMAHETETIGTLHVLRAAAEAKVTSVVSLSSAMCYGARPDNPAWISERQALRPPDSRSLRDKADADAQALRFSLEHPDVSVAVARVGAVVGSAPDHFFSRVFQRRVVPAALGYDPLWQLLWIDDAVAALHALYTARARGAYNVVGHGVLPLSHVLSRLAKVPLYLPSTLGRALIGALWSAQLVEMPASFVDYFRWPWVCDSARLRSDTGFVPAHDIATTLAVFATLGRGQEAP